MRGREAEELVSKREGRMCVRFYRRKDGTVMTENCPVGLKVVLRRVSRIAGIALSVAISAVSVVAQTKTFVQGEVVQNEASLELFVVDVQGAVCNGAKVQLKSESNQQVMTATTNDEGRLRLSRLAPGTYALTVTFPGFLPYEQRVTVAEWQATVLKATLQVPRGINMDNEDPVTEEQILIDIPAVEPPPLVFQPVPVPNPPPTLRRGFFRRVFDKLFHHSR
jgi:Carboxypeptidase regulatory-like domain